MCVRERKCWSEVGGWFWRDGLGCGCVSQFTMPGGRHALHHAVLLQKVGASRVLRTVAAAATAAMQAKVFARVVLRNLEHHQAESNTVVALS